MIRKFKKAPACSTERGATNNRFPDCPMHADHKVWKMATEFKRRSRRCMTFR